MSVSKTIKMIDKNISVRLANSLKKLSPDILNSMEEIRLRNGKPLAIKINRRMMYVSENGRLVNKNSITVTPVDMEQTFNRICRHSVHALEWSIKQGFITLEDGFRVGLAGSVALQGDDIRSMRRFSGFVFRISREIKGIALGIMEYLIENNKYVNTLIISPPGMGKTTLLRDIARIMGDGINTCCSVNTLIIDERREIACSVDGIPQLDVGINTEVLDSCPKAVGITMGIRSLAPDVIITDELAKKEDAMAAIDAAGAGVVIISSAHAGNVEQVIDRPALKCLFDNNIFRRIIVLGNSNGVGTVESIYDLGEKKYIGKVDKNKLIDFNKSTGLKMSFY